MNYYVSSSTSPIYARYNNGKNMWRIIFSQDGTNDKMQLQINNDPSSTASWRDLMTVDAGSTPPVSFPSGLSLYTYISTLTTAGSGTINLPAGTNRFEFTLVGGGGGASSQAAGGGGGGCVMRFSVLARVITTITYVVGAAGGTGANGGDSRLTYGAVTFTAFGGAGAVTTRGGNGGGAGGVVTGGTGSTSAGGDGGVSFPFWFGGGGGAGLSTLPGGASGYVSTSTESGGCSCIGTSATLSKPAGNGAGGQTPSLGAGAGFLQVVGYP